MSRFEPLFKKYGITTTTYEIETVKSLTGFIQRERTLPDQKFLLIDLTNASYSNNHILNAVQNLQRFIKAEVIFIAPPSTETTQLFGTLGTRFHLNGLIEDTGDEQALLNAVEKCISGDNSPMRFVENLVKKESHDTNQAVQPTPLEIGQDTVLEVAVAGTVPRCGTTTQTFELYHILKANGFSPAILDRNTTLIAPLWEIYKKAPDSHKDAQQVRIGGVHFCMEKSQEFNAYVSDLGVLNEWNAPVFAKADLSVLVTTTKPWELQAVLPKIKFAHEAQKDHELVVIASSTTPVQAQELEEIVGKIVTAPYQPDIWEPSVEASYAISFLPALKRACGMQPFSLQEIVPKRALEYDEHEFSYGMG